MKVSFALISVAQLVGASSRKLKGGWFDSCSGHMPEQCVESQPWAFGRGNCLTFSPRIDVSPLLAPFRPSLSKICKYTRMRIKIIYNHVKLCQGSIIQNGYGEPGRESSWTLPLIATYIVSRRKESLLSPQQQEAALACNHRKSATTSNLHFPPMNFFQNNPSQLPPLPYERMHLSFVLQACLQFTVVCLHQTAKK